MSKLYIVPTPIGNLEDITLRALNVLKSVDIILAEDTRTSQKLLSHYAIEKKLFSHHMHNEHKALPSLINRLSGGEVMALISDAGTPAISDPGFLLVRECVRNGIEVECLPGPTAFVPAIVNSGLPCERFCFEGFLPLKKGRQTRLKQLAEESRTMIFYESPHRLLKCLEELAQAFGPDRQASVSRELSKVHEENARGSLSQLIEHFKPANIKGEICIVVQGLEKE